jgi:hypothetical protein
MKDRHDDLMSSLVQELGDDPPLPPELEAEIWAGAQRKIAAGVVVTASAAIAVAAARAASAPAAAPLTVLSILSSVAGKVAVAVALAVGAVSGYVVRSVVEPAPAAPTIAAASPSSPSPSPSPPPSPSPSLSPSVPPPPPSPAVVVVEQRPATDVPKPPAPRQRREATPEAVATEITKRELVLMDRARAALSREDAADALAAVREQRMLPAPRGFDEESEAIEVFALGRLDRARAASAARAFLQKRPDSPLVDRVRSFAMVD